MRIDSFASTDVDQRDRAINSYAPATRIAEIFERVFRHEADNDRPCLRTGLQTERAARDAEEIDGLAVDPQHTLTCLRTGNQTSP